MIKSRELLSNCNDIGGRYKEFIQNVNAKGFVEDLGEVSV